MLFVIYSASMTSCEYTEQPPELAMKKLHVLKLIRGPDCFRVWANTDLGGFRYLVSLLYKYISG